MAVLLRLRLVPPVAVATATLCARLHCLQYNLTAQGQGSPIIRSVTQIRFATLTLLVPIDGRYTYDLLVDLWPYYIISQ
jgi:hypothetical protein